MRIVMAIVSIALLALAEPASAKEYRVSVKQHTGNSIQLTDEQVKKILHDASMILKQQNNDHDFACDITFKLEGSVEQWGDRGEDPLTVTKQLIDSVHREASSAGDLHVEIVDKINGFCRFDGVDFDGCAWPPNYRSIIVRQPRNINFEDPARGSVDPIVYSILWAHEFGHLMGLGHSEESNSLMSCGLHKNQNVVTEHECKCFMHGPGFGKNGECDLYGIRCP